MPSSSKRQKARTQRQINKKLKMPTLYIVIGAETCGKPTWIKKKVPDLPVVSLEEWPKFKADRIGADEKGRRYWIA